MPWSSKLRRGSQLHAGTSAPPSNANRDYPTGCTANDTPHYDAYLNFLKNRTPKPTVPPAKILTRLKDLTDLDDSMPEDLKPGQNAEQAAELAALGPGAIYGVIAYLYFVTVSEKESSNCQLDGNGTSYRIEIGFDSEVARRLRAGWKPSMAEMHELQQKSIVVVMTPHYRRWHQRTWADDVLTPFVGRQVKVVGQLLADSEHLEARDSCAHPNADERCLRASIWEIHPVKERL
jgi:hypothetical protein